LCEIRNGFERKGSTINNGNSNTMKILVVHRQRKTVDQIKSVLSRCNPVVLHTESGLDGLLTSRIEHFDVIICGTDLPVVSGFELIRSVRTNSINKHATAVLVADEIDDKTRYLGQALGVSAMLSVKDIDVRLLGIVTEQVIAKPDNKWQDLRRSSP